jgi:hypothetical protein
MSGTPSLTILSKEQKFNGDNLLQWNTNMTQLLGSKGLLGYIDGKILRPGPESLPLPSTPTTTGQYFSTPIYLTTPTLDKWTFHDQLVRGHITLNCTDIASLGVTTTGTAKDAWDLIQNKWGRSTDMRRSHAQEALNRIVYVEGTEIQDHIKLLQTRRAAVNNMSTSPMSDETWRGVIIQSIPPTPKWLPVIPSLYTMSSSADIVSTLFAHGMIIRRETNISTSTSSSNTAVVAWTVEACGNPNCKAKKQSTHMTANFYWPGGGKEGQFPPNLGQRNRVNTVTANTTATTSPQPVHFALSVQILDTRRVRGADQR